MFEIFFISYQEPNADKNWKSLKDRFPIARRIHGITGIHQAHIAAAKQSFTKMFYVVDGDSIVADNFNFDYEVHKLEKGHVHVWQSQNPVNDLVYGYGGIKLLPKEETINMDVTRADMTTSISKHFKTMSTVSNITAFNTDPFNTWKSAFRECVKLSSKIIDRQEDADTAERLAVWCSAGHSRPFGEYAINGAVAGRMFGEFNQDNLHELKKINDFAWLKEQYEQRAKNICS